MSNKSKNWVFLLCIALFLPISANAQLIIDWNAQWLRDQPLRDAQAREQAIRSENEEWEEENLGRSSPRKKTSSIKNLDFQHNPAISNQVRAEVLQELLQLGQEQGSLAPEQATVMREGLSQININDTVGVALERHGYPKHNLATAIVYWLITHLEIVHNTEFTEKQKKVVYDSMMVSLGESLEYKKMKDAEKQKMAEGMLWTALIPHLNWQNARKQGQAYMLKNSADLSRELLKKQLNIDADTITIADQGLVPKK